MADPLTAADVEHEDDRDRRDRRLEVGLEGERYAPAQDVERDWGEALEVAGMGASARRPCPAERPATHCSMCGKPLEAQLTCVACGDESELAA